MWEKLQLLTTQELWFDNHMLWKSRVLTSLTQLVLEKKLELVVI